MRFGKTALTLRTKTVLILIGILIVTGGMNTSVLLNYFSRHYRESLQQKAIVTGESFLKILHNALNLGLSLDQLEGINEQAKKIVEQHQDIGYVLVADRGGKILYHSDTRQVGKHSDNAAGTQVSTAEGPLIRLQRIGQEEYYDITLSIPDLNKTSPGVVHLGLKAQTISSKIQTLVFFSVSITLLSILLAGALMAFFLTRGVTRPISSLAEVTAQVAEGDLTQKVSSSSHDEIGLLAQSFQNMVSGLHQLVLQVRQGAEEMTSASAQIATTAEQGARGSEGAASAIEEITSTMHEVSTNTTHVAASAQTQAGAVTQTAAAIEEMVTSIQRVAEGAAQLTHLAESAHQAVAKSQDARETVRAGLGRANATLQETAAAIQTLGTKAADIDQIVEVIDDLAEQTNLLALNAAIEAARAGEHGLGFAVVAEEVRKLAERSAKSTREISELIRGIQTETAAAVHRVGTSTTLMAEGIAQSEAVGDLLAEIRAAVEKVTEHAQEIGVATAEQSRGGREIAATTAKLTELTAEISSATEEQSAGAGQVVQAMERMRELTQQNASSSTELAAAAEELARQAATLQAAVSRFGVGEYTGAGPVPPSRPAASPPPSSRPQPAESRVGKRATLPRTHASLTPSPLSGNGGADTIERRSQRRSP